ncbi:MAG: FAD-dependent oxidoreductase, partial [Clostridia bacterium]
MNDAAERFDVVVVGAGPAGLAAAIGAGGKGAKTLLIE